MFVYRQTKFKKKIEQIFNILNRLEKTR